MSEQKTRVLLFGATAGIGLWTAHNLLKNEDFSVKVVVRNKEKLTRLFKDRTD